MAKRIVASFTLLCFLLTLVPVQALQAAVESRRATEQALRLLQEPLLPVSLGRVSEAALPPAEGMDRRPLVIYIQDLHCHPEVQKNIDAILARLDERRGIGRIYLEGGIDGVDTSWAGLIGDRALRARVVETLLAQGKLTGAEYFAIRKDRSGILRGLEDGPVYLENLKRLDGLIAGEGAGGRSVEEMRRRTDSLKRTYYSRPNRKIDQLCAGMRAGDARRNSPHERLVRYARAQHIDTSPYRNIRRLITLTKLRGDVNARRISRELRRLMQDFRKKLPYRAYRELAAASPAGAADDSFSFRLMRLAAEYAPDLDRRYPALAGYLETLKLNASINPLELVQEERLLVRELQYRLSLSPAERDVVFLADFVRHLGEYVSREMSAESYEYYARNRAAFILLWKQYADIRGPGLLEDERSVLLDKFYAENLRRNGCFAENIRRGLPGAAAGGEALQTTDDPARILAAAENARDVTVVIAGGFHTGGLTALLRQHNYPYVVITPSVTHDLPFRSLRYEHLIHQQVLAAQAIPAMPISEWVESWGMGGSFAVSKGLVQAYGAAALIEEQIRAGGSPEKTVDALAKTGYRVIPEQRTQEEQRFSLTADGQRFIIAVDRKTAMAEIRPADAVPGVPPRVMEIIDSLEGSLSERPVIPLQELERRGWSFDFGRYHEYKPRIPAFIGAVTEKGALSVTFFEDQNARIAVPGEESAALVSREFWTCEPIVLSGFDSAGRKLLHAGHHAGAGRYTDGGFEELLEAVLSDIRDFRADPGAVLEGVFVQMSSDDDGQVQAMQRVLSAVAGKDVRTRVIARRMKRTGDPCKVDVYALRDGVVIRYWDRRGAPEWYPFAQPAEDRAAPQERGQPPLLSIFYGPFKRVQDKMQRGDNLLWWERVLHAVGDPVFGAPLWETAVFHYGGWTTVPRIASSSGIDAGALGYLWFSPVFSLLHTAVLWIDRARPENRTGLPVLFSRALWGSLWKVNGRYLADDAAQFGIRWAVSSTVFLIPYLLFDPLVASFAAGALHAGMNGMVIALKKRYPHSRTIQRMPVFSLSASRPKRTDTDQLILEYYEARDRLLKAIGLLDADMYSSAYETAVASARAVKTRVRDRDELAAAIARRKQSDPANRFLPPVVGEGQDEGDEILHSAGEEFNDQHRQWIRETVEMTVRAVPGFLHLPASAGERMISQAADRVVPYSMAEGVPRPEEMRRVFAGLRRDERGVIKDVLGGLAFADFQSYAATLQQADAIAQAKEWLMHGILTALHFRDTHNYGMTDVSGAAPRVIMHAIDNKAVFCYVLAHELKHYLDTLGITDNPSYLEISNHAVETVLMAGIAGETAEAWRATEPGIETAHPFFYEGMERERRSPGGSLSVEELERITGGAIERRRQVRGADSGMPANELQEQDQLQRSMGIVLGGVLWARARDEALRHDAEASQDAAAAIMGRALETVMHWDDTVLAEYTRDFLRFSPDPERRKRLFDEIEDKRYLFRDGSDTRELVFAEQASTAGAGRKVFAKSEDADTITIHYVPELLDNPDDEVGKALFYEQLYAAMHSDPGRVEPEYRREENSFFMALFSDLELLRTRERAVQQGDTFSSAFRHLNEALYPNPHSMSARRRMNSLPPIIQFLEAVLYEGRTGEGADPRVSDRDVSVALQHTRRLRAGIIQAPDTREAYRLIRDRLWANELVRSLMERSLEQLKEQALEREAAERTRQTGETTTPEELRNGMSDAARQALQHAMMQQLIDHLQEHMQAQTPANPNAGAAAQQADKDKYQEAVDGMKSQVQHGQELLSGMQQLLKDLAGDAGGVQDKAGGMQGEAGKLRSETGKRSVTPADIEKLKAALDGIREHTAGLRQTGKQLKDNSSQLDAAGKAMNNGPAPSAGDITQGAAHLDESSGRLDDDIGELAKHVKQLAKSLKHLEELAQQPQPGTQQERAGAGDVEHDAGLIGDKVNDIAGAGKEMSSLLEGLKEHLDAAGRELKDPEADGRAGETRGQDAPGAEESEPPFPAQDPETGGDTRPGTSEPSANERMRQELLRQFMEEERERDRQDAERTTPAEVTDRSAEFKVRALSLNEKREMAQLLAPLRSRAGTLRSGIIHNLNETNLSLPLLGQRSGVLDPDNVAGIPFGTAMKKEDMLPGEVKHRILFVLDTSGSMGSAEEPDDPMRHMIDTVLLNLLALKGIPGIEAGVMVYGDSAADMLLKFTSAVDLRNFNEQEFYLLFKRFSQARGSTNDIETLYAGAGVITKDADEYTEMTVIHLTDGNPDEPHLRPRVQRLYENMYAGKTGENVFVPAARLIKWATWVIGKENEGEVRKYVPDQRIANRFRETGNVPHVGFIPDSSTLLREIPSYVSGVFKGRRTAVAVGRGLEKLLIHAVSMADPAGSFIRAEFSRILGREVDSEGSVLADALRRTPQIAQRLLDVMFSGKDGKGYLLGDRETRRKYDFIAGLEESLGTKIAVSRAPLSLLAPNYDSFALATITGNPRAVIAMTDPDTIILHESILETLLRRGPPESWRKPEGSPGAAALDRAALAAAYLKDQLIPHETEERDFLLLAAQNDAASLRSRWPGITADDVVTLRRDPARAGAIFHRLTESRYGSLFDLADEVIDSSRRDITYIGYRVRGGRTLLRMRLPGDARCTEVETDVRSDDPRRVRLYVKANGAYEEVLPGTTITTVPEEIGFSVQSNGTPVIRGFAFTRDNIVTLSEILKAYSNPKGENSNIMLEGPRGSGKNTLGYVVAALTGQPVRILSFHAHMGVMDLKYHYGVDIATAEVELELENLAARVKMPAHVIKRLWSEVYEAALADHLLILDEVDKVQLTGVLSALNLILTRMTETRFLADNRGKNYIGERFRVMAFVNDDEGDIHSKDLKSTARDFARRFVWIPVDYMSPVDELDYVMRTVFGGVADPGEYAACGAAMAKVIRVAAGIRAEVRKSGGTLARYFSTRGVIKVARHLRHHRRDVETWFRSVFEKAYASETLDGGREVIDDIIKNSGLPDKTFEDGIKDGTFDAERVIGDTFEYSIEDGAVYCYLGKEDYRVRVKTGIEPSDDAIARARAGLKTHWHIPENMYHLWCWMKEISMGNGIMVLGVPGTWKSLGVRYLVETVLQRPYTVQQLDVSTRGNTILGNMTTDDRGRTVFEKEPQAVAMERGCIGILEEIDKVREKTALSATNNAEEFGTTTLEDGSVLNVAPGFISIWIGNLHNKGGTLSSQKIGGDVLDRKSVFIMRPLSEKSVAEILRRQARKDGYETGERFIGQLAAAFIGLGRAAAADELPAAPDIGALDKLMDAVGRFPEKLMHLEREFLRVFPVNKAHHDKVIEVLNRKRDGRSLVETAREEWITAIGRRHGYPFSQKEIEGYGQEIVWLAQEITARRFPNPERLNEPQLREKLRLLYAGILAQVAQHEGALLFAEYRDTGGALEPEFVSVVDMLASGLQLEAGHREKLIEERYPVLKHLKEISHLQMIREALIDGGELPGQPWLVDASAAVLMQAVQQSNGKGVWTAKTGEPRTIFDLAWSLFTAEGPGTETARQALQGACEELFPDYKKYVEDATRCAKPEQETPGHELDRGLRETVRAEVAELVRVLDVHGLDKLAAQVAAMAGIATPPARGGDRSDVEKRMEIKVWSVDTDTAHVTINDTVIPLPAKVLKLGSGGSVVAAVLADGSVHVIDDDNNLLNRGDACTLNGEKGVFLHAYCLAGDPVFIRYTAAGRSAPKVFLSPDGLADAVVADDGTITVRGLLEPDDAPSFPSAGVCAWEHDSRELYYVSPDNEIISFTKAGQHASVTGAVRGRSRIIDLQKEERGFMTATLEDGTIVRIDRTGEVACVVEQSGLVFEMFPSFEKLISVTVDGGDAIVRDAAGTTHRLLHPGIEALGFGRLGSELLEVADAQGGMHWIPSSSQASLLVVADVQGGIHLWETKGMREIQLNEVIEPGTFGNAGSLRVAEVERKGAQVIVTVREQTPGGSSQIDFRYVSLFTVPQQVSEHPIRDILALLAGVQDLPAGAVMAVEKLKALDLEAMSPQEAMRSAIAELVSVLNARGMAKFANEIAGLVSAPVPPAPGLDLFTLKDGSRVFGLRSPDGASIAYNKKGNTLRVDFGETKHYAHEFYWPNIAAGTTLSWSKAGSILLFMSGRTQDPAAFSSSLLNPDAHKEIKLGMLSENAVPGMRIRYEYDSGTHSAVRTVSEGVDENDRLKHWPEVIVLEPPVPVEQLVPGTEVSVADARDTVVSYSPAGLPELLRAYISGNTITIGDAVITMDAEVAKIGWWDEYIIAVDKQGNGCFIDAFKKQIVKPGDPFALRNYGEKLKLWEIFTVENSATVRYLEQLSGNMGSSSTKRLAEVSTLPKVYPAPDGKAEAVVTGDDEVTVQWFDSGEKRTIPCTAFAWLNTCESFYFADKSNWIRAATRGEDAPRAFHLGYSGKPGIVSLRYKEKENYLAIIQEDGVVSCVDLDTYGVQGITQISGGMTKIFASLEMDIAAHVEGAHAVVTRGAEEIIRLHHPEGIKALGWYQTIEMLVVVDANEKVHLWKFYKSPLKVGDMWTQKLRINDVRYDAGSGIVTIEFFDIDEDAPSLRSVGMVPVAARAPVPPIIPEGSVRGIIAQVTAAFGAATPGDLPGDVAAVVRTLAGFIARETDPDEAVRGVIAGLADAVGKHGKRQLAAGIASLLAGPGSGNTQVLKWVNLYGTVQAYGLVSPDGTRVAFADDGVFTAGKGGLVVHTIGKEGEYKSYDFLLGNDDEAFTAAVSWAKDGAPVILVRYDAEEELINLHTRSTGTDEINLSTVPGMKIRYVYDQDAHTATRTLADGVDEEDKLKYWPGTIEFEPPLPAERLVPGADASGDVTRDTVVSYSPAGLPELLRAHISGNTVTIGDTVIPMDAEVAKIGWWNEFLVAVDGKGNGCFIDAFEKREVKPGDAFRAFGGGDERSFVTVFSERNYARVDYDQEGPTSSSRSHTIDPLTEVTALPKVYPSPDGKAEAVVTGADEVTVHWFDSGEERTIRCSAFAWVNGSGRYYFVDESNRIKLNVKGGDEPAVFHSAYVGKSRIVGFRYNEKNKYFEIVQEDGTVSHVSRETSEVQGITQTTGGITEVYASLQMATAARAEGTYAVVTRGAEELGRFPHPKGIKALGWYDSNEMLVVVDKDEKVHLWSMINNAPLRGGDIWAGKLRVDGVDYDEDDGIVSIYFYDTAKDEPFTRRVVVAPVAARPPDRAVISDAAIRDIIAQVTAAFGVSTLKDLPEDVAQLAGKLAGIIGNGPQENEEASAGASLSGRQDLTVVKKTDGEQAYGLIAPDGEHLFYGGGNRLWVRNVSTGEVREVPEDADFRPQEAKGAAWSADGGFILLSFGHGRQPSIVNIRETQPKVIEIGREYDDVGPWKIEYLYDEERSEARSVIDRDAGSWKGEIRFLAQVPFELLERRPERVIPSPDGRAGAVVREREVTLRDYLLSGRDHTLPCTAFAWHPVKHTAYLGYKNGMVMELGKDGTTSIVRDHADDGATVVGLIFSRDGKRLRIDDAGGHAGILHDNDEFHVDGKGPDVHVMKNRLPDHAIERHRPANVVKADFGGPSERNIASLDVRGKFVLSSYHGLSSAGGKKNTHIHMCPDGVAHFAWAPGGHELVLYYPGNVHQIAFRGRDGTSDSRRKDIRIDVELVAMGLDEYMRYFAAVDKDGKAGVWDIATGDPLKPGDACGDAFFVGNWVLYTARGTEMLVVTKDANGVLNEQRIGLEGVSLPLLEQANYGGKEYAVCSTHDNRLILTVMRGLDLLLCHVLERFGTIPHDVKIVDEGNYVVATGKNGKLAVWTTENGAMLLLQDTKFKEPSIKGTEIVAADDERRTLRVELHDPASPSRPAESKLIELRAPAAPLHLLRSAHRRLLRPGHAANPSKLRMFLEFVTSPGPGVMLETLLLAFVMDHFGFVAARSFPALLGATLITAVFAALHALSDIDERYLDKSGEFRERGLPPQSFAAFIKQELTGGALIPALVSRFVRRFFSGHLVTLPFILAPIGWAAFGSMLLHRHVLIPRREGSTARRIWKHIQSIPAALAGKGIHRLTGRAVIERHPVMEFAPGLNGKYIVHFTGGKGSSLRRAGEIAGSGVPVVAVLGGDLPGDLRGARLLIPGDCRYARSGGSILEISAVRNGRLTVLGYRDTGTSPVPAGEAGAALLAHLRGNPRFAKLLGLPHAAPDIVLVDDNPDAELLIQEMSQGPEDAAVYALLGLNDRAATPHPVLLPQGEKEHADDDRNGDGRSVSLTYDLLIPHDIHMPDLLRMLGRETRQKPVLAVSRQTALLSVNIPVIEQERGLEDTAFWEARIREYRELMIDTFVLSDIPGLNGLSQRESAVRSIGAIARKAHDAGGRLVVEYSLTDTGTRAAAQRTAESLLRSGADGIRLRIDRPLDGTVIETIIAVAGTVDSEAAGREPLMAVVVPGEYRSDAGLRGVLESHGIRLVVAYASSRELDGQELPPDAWPEWTPSEGTKTGVNAFEREMEQLMAMRVRMAGVSSNGIRQGMLALLDEGIREPGTWFARLLKERIRVLLASPVRRYELARNEALAEWDIEPLADPVRELLAAAAGALDGRDGARETLERIGAHTGPAEWPGGLRRRVAAVLNAQAGDEEAARIGLAGYLRGVLERDAVAREILEHAAWPRDAEHRPYLAMLGWALMERGGRVIPADEAFGEPASAEWDDMLREVSAWDAATARFGREDLARTINRLYHAAERRSAGAPPQAVSELIRLLQLYFENPRFNLREELRGMEALPAAVSAILGSA